MSRIEEMIAELCPDGVKFIPLGDVCTLITGATPNTKNPEYWQNGTIPWMSSGEVNKRVIYETETKITQIGYEKTSTSLVPAHTVVIALAGQGKTRGKVAVTEIELCTNQSLCSIVCGERVNYKFLFYYLDGKYEELRTISNGDGTRGGLSLKLLNPYKIPVPPLEVQAEIVKVLDKYTTSVTELQQELEKELTARKKQYEYYSSRLFLDTNAPEIEMSELADFVYGYTDTAKDVGDTRFVRITDINEQGYLKQEDQKYITMTEDAKKSILRKGDIIMARTGATFGKVLYFDSDFPSVYASFLIKIIPNEKLLSRYYWHFTKTSLYWEQAKKLVTTGGQPQFNTPAVKKIRIPIPPIKEQERIVSILDRFDKLCNDISEGLPAEIEARRKQYEYYRDKLLSFEEVKA